MNRHAGSAGHVILTERHAVISASGGFDESCMHIETLAVHAGAGRSETGAVTPPIHLSTTFERAPDGSYPGGFIYSRGDNPNRQALEACLAQLEGGAAAAAFSSARRPPSRSCSRSARRPRHRARGTRTTARRTCCSIISGLGAGDHAGGHDDPAAVEAAVRPNTRLVWVETPSNHDSRQRYRGDRRDRAPRVGARRLRQHLGDAHAAASAPARRRSGDARDHQVSGWPQRHPRRRASWRVPMTNCLRGSGRCRARRARCRRRSNRGW